jgi:hypothetical protein
VSHCDALERAGRPRANLKLATENGTQFASSRFLETLERGYNHNRADRGVENRTPHETSLVFRAVLNSETLTV